MSIIASIGTAFSAILKGMTLWSKRSKRKRIEKDEDIRNDYVDARDNLRDSLPDK